MNRFLLNTVFYCLSITVCAHAMLPLPTTNSADNAHILRPGLLSLQEIVTNSLAKEKVHSYLSRPTCPELSKADDILRLMLPEDLLADVTSTQSKTISLANRLAFLDMHTIVEHPDATKVSMVATFGHLFDVDVITQKMSKAPISCDRFYQIDSDPQEVRKAPISCDGFGQIDSTDPINCDDDSDYSLEECMKDLIKSYQENSLDHSSTNKDLTSSYAEKSLGQSDTSSDYAFSSDNESSNWDDWISACGAIDCAVINHQSIYQDIALSLDGRVWALVPSVQSDSLLIGKVADSFDLKACGNTQAYKQINMADELGTNYGRIGKLALRSDGSQCVAVWEPSAMTFNKTHKLIFWQNDGSRVKETIEIPRVSMLAYAHKEPVLLVGHENGIVSLWDTQKAAQISALRFCEPEELMTAMGISHDDGTIYVGTVMGRLSAFNRTAQHNNRRYAYDGVVRVIQSHPQGLCVATAADNGSDGNVVLWNKDTTKKLATFPYHATALNFSHDGTFLYVVTKDKQFHRIPLGNPWELVCHRAWLACKDDQSQREEFKNWGIYKKVMSQEQKTRSVLGEQLRQYLALSND